LRIISNVVVKLQKSRIIEIDFLALSGREGEPTALAQEARHYRLKGCSTEFLTDPILALRTSS